MGKLYVLILMLFLHVVDDYYLQGILASMKQQAWWKENAPDKKYKNDYIVALLMHSFSWAFMIMLPIAAYLDFNTGIAFYIVLFINCLTHATVDHMKANKYVINLVQDQTIHVIQIIATGCYFLYM